MGKGGEPSGRFMAWNEDCAPPDRILDSDTAWTNEKKDSSMANSQRRNKTAHELSITGALLALLLFSQSVDQERGVKFCANGLES